MKGLDVLVVASFLVFGGTAVAAAILKEWLVAGLASGLGLLVLSQLL